jgi:type II secretory ATPase GspE/PulE/Tfp pilus assembly ATPase PilB-like protein
MTTNDPATEVRNFTTDNGAVWVEQEEAEVPAVVRGLLERACTLGVSDLVLATEEDSVAITARHLGMWQDFGRLGHDLGRRCLSHIKTMAGMDIAEHRRPLDGRWIYERQTGEVADLRVSTLPTLHGEDCTLRLLLRGSQLLSLDKLGLQQRDYNSLLQMLSNPSGLLLVTGPTGSGKTTTLYACLNQLNNGQRKINTIEDPVEYALPGIRQSQVHPAIGLDFASLLRGVLRQTPDIIMVGEVRDEETAAITVQAANAGQLVLATLHAPVAAAAVPALLSFGIHPYQLASCLLGCVAQRLIRTLDPATRVPYDLSMAPGVFDEIRAWLRPEEGSVIYGPSRETTEGLGYANRTGVFEVMPVTPALRQLIMRQQPASALRLAAVEEGMIEMRQAALLAVARGETSIEEVFRAIPAEYLDEAA